MAPDATPQPSPASGLLVLIRKLIDYGKELAGALRQHGTAALGFPPCRFGTDDVALILARIARGLHLAAALEVRITASAARLDADPQPRRTPVRSAPRAPRAAALRTDTACRLAAMPTPEQIAAEARRRPIGAVIADICRDLGILPSHPLWRTLQSAIIRYNGNYARLVKDLLDRLFPLPGPTAMPDASLPRLAAPASTGPP